MMYEIVKIKESSCLGNSGIVAIFGLDKMPPTKEELVTFINKRVNGTNFWKALTNPQPGDDLYIIQYAKNPVTEEFDYKTCIGIVKMMKDGTVGEYRTQTAVEQATCDAYILRQLSYEEGVKKREE